MNHKNCVIKGTDIFLRIVSFCSSADFPFVKLTSVRNLLTRAELFEGRLAPIQG